MPDDDMYGERARTEESISSGPDHKPETGPDPLLLAILAKLSQPAGQPEASAGSGRPGVRWVRAGALLNEATAIAAGQGIRWVTAANQRGHDALRRGARRLRTGVATAIRRSGSTADEDRMSRLAPPEAFGAGREQRPRRRRSDRSL